MRSVDSVVHWRSLQIIYTAFPVSLIIYGLLLYLMQRYGTLPTEGYNPSLAAQLRYPLYAVALANWFAVLFLRRLLLDPHRLRRATKPVAELITKQIILFALSEAIGLWGFILTLLGGQTVEFLFLGMLSLFTLITLAPRYHLFDELVRLEASRP
jgi:F0F1-type ATP synthase membrane subunit c/vacuolar-type H+-ATPase subunit K